MCISYDMIWYDRIWCDIVYKLMHNFITDKNGGRRSFSSPHRRSSTFLPHVAPRWQHVPLTSGCRGWGNREVPPWRCNQLGISTKINGSNSKQCLICSMTYIPEMVCFNHPRLWRFMILFAILAATSWIRAGDHSWACSCLYQLCASLALAQTSKLKPQIRCWQSQRFSDSTGDKPCQIPKCLGQEKHESSTGFIFHHLLASSWAFPQIGSPLSTTASWVESICPWQLGNSAVLGFF